MAFSLLLACLSFFNIISFNLLSYGGVDNVLPPLPLGNSELGLPALYVFGDSYIDSGNNNFLPTISRVNYLPYGIDFGRIPTGRATNGRMVVDFLGMEKKVGGICLYVHYLAGYILLFLTLSLFK